MYPCPHRCHIKLFFPPSQKFGDKVKIFSVFGQMLGIRVSQWDHIFIVIFIIIYLLYCIVFLDSFGRHTKFWNNKNNQPLHNYFKYVLLGEGVNKNSQEEGRARLDGTVTVLNQMLGRTSLP